MENHSRFEVLCALAASGQLTSAESAELHRHCSGCLECSNRLVELVELGGNLFCVHALKEPATRMPEKMLESFIARANSEGVPLSPCEARAGNCAPSLKAVLVLVLLLVSATLRFGLLGGFSAATARHDVSSDSRSLRETANTSLRAPLEVTTNDAHSSLTSTRQKETRERHKAPSPASSRRSPETKAIRPENNQLDLIAYSQNLTTLSRPLFVSPKLDRTIDWSSSAYQTPRLDFTEPPKFAENDPPKLFADYEQLAFASFSPHVRFAPGPPDAQTLRRDFDSDSNETQLRAGRTGKPPVFQFTRLTRQ